MPLVDKEIFRFDRFVLDLVERTLSCDGTPVSLTPKAFDTLICLVRNQGRMVTKDELLSQVWPDTFVEEINLAVNISTIRKALGESAQESRFIVTVPGRGYRFGVEVRRLAHQNGNKTPTDIAKDSSDIGADGSHGLISGTGDTTVVVPVKRGPLRLAIVVAVGFLVTALSARTFGIEQE